MTDENTSDSKSSQTQPPDKPSDADKQADWNGSADLAEDQEILELTERTIMVPTADEEELIDLDKYSDDDDEILDLTQPATGQEQVQDQDENDEILDLTDPVTDQESDDILDLTETADAADEDILDLTETVDTEADDDEDILDLTETVETPAVDDDDDDILDLTETVETGSAEADADDIIDLTAVADEDKELLELTEDTQVLDDAEEQTVALDDILEGFDQDDDIVDLTDTIIEEGEDDDAEAPLDLTESVPPAAAETADDEIVDLTEPVETSAEDEADVFDLTETVDAPAASESDVMDLTNEAVEADTERKETAPATEAPDEGDVLDLMDTVEQDPEDLPKMAAKTVDEPDEATVYDGAVEVTEDSLVSDWEDGEEIDLRDLDLSDVGQTDLADEEEPKEDSLHLADDMDARPSDDTDLEDEDEDDELLDLTADVPYEDDEDDDLLSLTEEFEDDAKDDIIDLSQDPVDAEEAAAAMGLPEQEAAATTAPAASEAGEKTQAVDDTVDMDAEDQGADTATSDEPPESPPSDADFLEFSDTVEMESMTEESAATTAEEDEEDTGSFAGSLNQELESALENASSRESGADMLAGSTISVHLHNRQDVDMPTDLDSEAIDKWHQGVRQKVADATGAVAISPEQLEGALVKAIKDIYSEKIETLIEEAVEKTILQEIERLKKLLSTD